jgi:hypothetical protein
LASRAAFSAEVAEGLFGLVFQGNAPDLGQTTSLSPTHVRWLQWNRLAFGLGNATGTSFLDVGVYQAAWGADGGIADGGFWVAEDVDALEVGMEADVNFWERSGWGLGLDFRHQWGSERWIALEGRNLGVVRYGAGERLVVDTGLVTTGLGWSGPGWTVEGVQAEGFGSGLVERRSVGEGWQVLPMLGTVRAGAVHGKHVRGEGGVSWGGWMPRPRVEVMATWQPQAHWAFTGGAIAGGWGILRPVIGVERRSVDSAWSLTWDDPLGSVRSVGRGRGVAFSWIRNL